MREREKKNRRSTNQSQIEIRNNNRHRFPHSVPKDDLNEYSTTRPPHFFFVSSLRPSLKSFSVESIHFRAFFMQIETLIAIIVFPSLPCIFLNQWTFSRSPMSSVRRRTANSVSAMNSCLALSISHFHLFSEAANVLVLFQFHHRLFFCLE